MLAALWGGGSMGSPRNYSPLFREKFDQERRSLQESGVLEMPTDDELEERIHERLKKEFDELSLKLPEGMMEKIVNSVNKELATESLRLNKKWRDNQEVLRRDTRWENREGA